MKFITQLNIHKFARETDKMLFSLRMLFLHPDHSPLFCFDFKLMYFPGIELLQMGAVIVLFVFNVSELPCVFF